MPLFIIFILIPLVEIAVFMMVGEQIGLGTTLLLALLTAIIGGTIIRHQGLQTLHESRRDLGAGQVPMKEIFDGFCLIAAGALLITPGFVTDTIGFILLIPLFRGALRRGLKDHMNVYTNMAQRPGRKSTQDYEPIEVEYEHLDQDENKE